MNERPSLQSLKKRFDDSGRKPDFSQIQTILDRGVPARVTPFEFIINDGFLEIGAGYSKPDETDIPALCRFLVDGFTGLGYDYATLGGWQFKAIEFPSGESHQKQSKSLNEGAVIRNRHDFEQYPWPRPEESDYSALDQICDFLPEGAKMLVSGSMGILETIIDLVGFDNLCYMLYEDPDLTKDIFDAIGSAILSYYKQVLPFESVGAVIYNDDWGFKTQTMIHPDQLRQYVFPWVRKITEAVHAAKKSVLIHSCGNLETVMDEIIENLNLDGKHSFEDTITPVENAYALWGSRIAILGGLDVDYLCKTDPETIKERVRNLIVLTRNKGSYAVGSGNSIPDYIPEAHYAAMLEASLFPD